LHNPGSVTGEKLWKANPDYLPGEDEEVVELFDVMRPIP
jgi:hypothetical protein